MPEPFSTPSSFAAASTLAAPSAPAATSISARASHRLSPRLTLLLAGAMTLFCAFIPILRARYRLEIGYNEGWNVYNAQILRAHGTLYPAHLGWTTVNYPMLSFALLAGLSHWTHDLLFTARALSILALLGCGLLTRASVRTLGGTPRAATLAGLFCVALFCANANEYIGEDDPQMLALVLFMAGLYVYLRRRESPLAIAGAALLFVVGGSVKHNPVDIPLAVLIDLLLVSRARAAWFAASGLVFAAAAVWLNLHFGGPGFFQEMFAARRFWWSKSLEQLMVVLGPVLLPVVLAAVTAVRGRRDSRRRILALLLASGVLLGAYFGGGEGVSINCLFTALLATALMLGLLLSDAERGRWTLQTRSFAAPTLTAAVFLWLLIPLLLSGLWDPIHALRQLHDEQSAFTGEVATMHRLGSPALCESLLRCASAGEPYLYDPFNATRLFRAGRLDEDVLLGQIERHRFAVIQLDRPLDKQDRSERFDAPVLRAIASAYRPTLNDAGTVLYVPR